MMSRVLLPLGLAAALTAAAAAPAGAQDAEGPVSTASAAPAPTAQGQIQSLPTTNDPQPIAEETPVRDNKIHGMIDVGVGTGGYRHGAIAADAPLPGGGDVAVAVSETQIDPERGHRR